MSKTIFISYDFSNAKYAKKIEGWLKPPHKVYRWREEDLHPRPASEGQRKINKLLNSCQVMIVLIGQNSHNRPWLDWEVQMGISKGLKIVPVRIPNTSGRGPLQINHLHELKYGQQELLMAVR